MLTISTYLRTIQDYLRNSHMNDTEYVLSFFRILFRYVYADRNVDSMANFSAKLICEMLSEKAKFSSDYARDICNTDRSVLMQAFTEISSTLLDERRLKSAQQDVLELAMDDPYCQDLVDSYKRLGEDYVAFFMMTFLDALAKRTKKGKRSIWRICSVAETKKKPLAVAEAVMDNDRMLYNLPKECSGTAEQWANLFQRFPESARFLMRDDKILGNFSFVVLTDDEEERMLQGTLIDSDIDTSRCGPLAEGTYSIYLLNLSINSKVPLEWYIRLWNAFFDQIKAFAKRGIYITRVYTKVFIPEHEARMLGRGFYYHRTDAVFGKIYIRKIVHTSTDVEEDDLPVSLSNKIRAQEAYYDLFKELDELFLDPRFAHLKPYFFEGKVLDEEDKHYELGVAVARFVRDVMQYTSELVAFTPPHRQKSHRHIMKLLATSSLIHRSGEQYCFTTEIKDGRNSMTATNPTAILHFARIWLGIDRLFLEKDTLFIRAYLHDKADELPTKDWDTALAVAIRLLSSLQIAEKMLDHLPTPLILSFYEYVRHIKQSRLIREVIAQYPFLSPALSN